MTVWKKKQLAQSARRHEFAVAALAGISSHVTGPEKKTSETNPEAHARWAWAVADAMLKAREA